MGLVDRLRPKAAMTPQQEQMIREIWGGGITSSGVPINSESAMRLITVQNCVRLRASTLSRLPCHMMEQVGRMKNKAVDFYLYDMLLNQPNSWMTAPEFWSMAEAHVSLRGNFFAYKLGLSGRPILELIPIKAGAVEEVEQADDYSLTYHVRFKNGEKRPIPAGRIFHLRSLTTDGILGLNPIHNARETVGLGLAGEKFLARFFGSGLHPGAVIKHPLPLNSPAHAALRANLKEKYEGLGKTHEFMLIDEGMEIEFPTIKLVDAQFLEQMKMTEAQICALFRVPLMLVGASAQAPTYASAEQFMLFYQMFSIDAPHYESAIRRDLLTPEEKKKYFAKFNMDALQRGAFRDRMEGFQIGVNSEILNPNEVRDLLDRNPYPGGDEYRTRTSTVKEPGEGKPPEEGAMK
jgi:HK97 family phage portal protein